jgi:gliding motility-associated-like protein
MANALTYVPQDIVYPVVEAGAQQTISCDLPTVWLTGTFSGNPVVTHWFLNNTEIAFNQPQVEVNQAGWFTFVATNTVNGCISRDSVEILPPPVGFPYITAHPPMCDETQGTISIDSVAGGTPPFKYRLNNSPFYPTNSFLKLDPGMYAVLVRDALGCIDTQFVEIPTPPVFTATAEATATLIKLGEEITLSATTNIPSNEILSVLWTSPQSSINCQNCFVATASPTHNTIFYVTFTNPDGCQAIAHITVLVDTIPDIWFPNSFSPNSDGHNDLFFPFANPNEQMISEVALFQVFDRWGTLHHEAQHFLPNDSAFGWDGTSRGTPLAPAVFAWQAEIILIDGRRKLMFGDLTLVR